MSRELWPQFGVRESTGAAGMGKTCKGQGPVVKACTPARVIPRTRKVTSRGAWGAQSVKRPTSAQVMISQCVSSSPASGSVPTARSLEPASDSVSPSLSALLCLHSVCVSVSQK